MQRVFHSILIACFITLSLSAADSGLTERYKKIQGEMMQRRMSVKSQADMQRVVTAYMESCRTLLDEYDVSQLTGEDKETAIGIFFEIGETDRAWKLLEPMLTEEELSENLVSLAAGISFAMDEDVRGFKWLDRLNRESRLYQMMCLTLSVQRMNEAEPSSAEPFLERALDTSTLRQDNRFVALKLYGILGDFTGRTTKAISQINQAFRRGILGNSQVHHLKIQRKHLKMLGKQAYPLVGVGEWVYIGNEKDPVMKGKARVLLFFQPKAGFQNDFVKRVIAAVETCGADRIQIIGITYPSGLFGEQAKEMSESEKRSLVMDKVAKVKEQNYPFPVAVTDSRMIWDEYTIGDVAQAFLVSEGGIIEHVLDTSTPNLMIEQTIQQLQSD